jgi:hypothetical protein
MKMESAVSLFAGLALAVASTPSASANVYDAVNDFPVISPLGTLPVSANGVWAYGFATTPVPPANFTPDPLSTTDYFGDGGSAAGFYVPTTGTPGTYPLPTVLKNVTGATIPVEGGTIGPWPADLLLMHPGPSGDYSVVQFTAPASATYVVNGEFLAMGNYSGVTDDSVYGPGSALLYTTTSLSTPHTFSLTETLKMGQSLDFAVGLGPSGEFYYDSTGFDATISATPEPGFYGLLALGISSLAFVLARSRSTEKP